MPGSCFPSKNSRVAPPPVETNETCLLACLLLINTTESPPPIIETAPFSVALIILVRIYSEPTLNSGTSKTPIGPFQKIEPACVIISL